MATVNFSVPQDVKETFDAAFKGRNKSAIIADLMREAVERKKLAHRRTLAAERLLVRRNRKRTVSEAQVRAARSQVRK